MKVKFRNIVILCFIHGENESEIQKLVKTIFCEINSLEKKHKNNITTQLYFRFIYCLLFNLKISVLLQ